MLIALEVASFAVQADNNAPLVILKETGGDRTIAVPIGSYEASAIAIKSLNVISEKPLTIDLVKSIVETFQGKIEKVIINGPLSDPSAYLYVIFGNQTRVIECRPGDGISLAMRTEQGFLPMKKFLETVLEFWRFRKPNSLKAEFPISIPWILEILYPINRRLCHEIYVYAVCGAGPVVRFGFFFRR